MGRLLDLFPVGSTTDSDGMLILGGCRADALAAEFGTPVMVVAEPALRARARQYADELTRRWPNGRVVFASKSFPCTAVQRVMVEEGLGLDVAGGGEILSALRAGVDPALVVLHGNAKTDEEIELAVRHALGLVVVDGPDDIDRLEATVPAGRVQDVLIRVIPGITADTHEHILTGHEGSKFGVPPDRARGLVARLQHSSRVRLRGLHAHVGSQILDAEPLAAAVAPLAALGTFDVYDLGGGLGARYTWADEPPSVPDYLDVLTTAAKAQLPAGQSELARSIGLFQLAMFGVGATIGTGVFFVLSEAVPIAGPAVIWSFVIAGVVAGLTAVCYAELAGAVPVSGSSYSYSYATIGELPAMIVGACLLLEYGVSGAAVSVGWSQYLNALLQNLFGFQIPAALSQAPEQGGLVNLPAIILVTMCCLLLMRGASESATVNTVMVLIKIGVLVMFVLIGVTGWNSNNLADFAPFGLNGVTAASGIIFFSYIGLDAVSTAGEEVKDPHRTMPIAIMIALVVVTGLYVLVSLVAVAAQPYTQFEGQEAGLAQILENITGSTWPSTVLAAGAVVSIFSVTLIVIYGQSRILFAMARDGMIPELFHRVDPRTRTPVANTVIVSAVIAVLAGFVPINFLAEMTSVGTLVAFLVVSIAVIVLRQRQPDLPRTFRVPGYPVVPILSVLGCLWIIKDLRSVTLIVFVVWVGVVLIWYFTYGLKHSHLGRHEHVGLIKDTKED